MKLIPFISIVMLMACSFTGKEDMIMKEATSVHNTMIEKAEKLKGELEIIRSNLTTRMPVDSIHKLLTELEEWEKELVEVPGNEEHHHAKHEHHDHAPLNVTSREMLYIQYDFKQRLDSIERKFNAIKN